MGKGSPLPVRFEGKTTAPAARPQGNTRRMDAARSRPSSRCFKALAIRNGPRSHAPNLIPNLRWGTDLFWGAISRPFPRSAKAWRGECAAVGRAIRQVGRQFLSVTNPTFHYDGNGNMTDGAGRSFVWKSFNRIKKLTQGATVLNWTYGRAAWGFSRIPISARYSAPAV